MLSRLTDPNVLLTGLILAVVQFLAALPWLRAIDRRGFDRVVKSPEQIAYTVGGLLLAGLALAGYVGFKGESAGLVGDGRIYAAVLHIQLMLDLFLAAPAAVLLVAPKTGAIALAAYREGCRQPLFGLVLAAGVAAIWVSVVIPYFTFGDDYKMMKQIAFDIVMLAAVVFGVLAASASVSDEIEGRTALTVMSKPVSRRQFLLGKYLGILMAAGVLTLLLGWHLNAACLANPEFDPINKDRAFDPLPEEAKSVIGPAVQKVFPAGAGKVIAQGIGMWAGETFANSFGLLLGFGQVMVLVAIATALATRLPFVLNLALILLVYFLGHLAPVLVRVGDLAKDKSSLGAALTRFLGNLFDTLLPALEFFTMGPAIIRDTPLSLWPFVGYVATVTGYAAIYTTIALIVGLLLFEDRDLA